VFTRARAHLPGALSSAGLWGSRLPFTPACTARPGHEFAARLATCRISHYPCRCG